jgi:hypothetical protein
MMIAPAWINYRPLVLGLKLGDAREILLALSTIGALSVVYELARLMLQPVVTMPISISVPMLSYKQQSVQVHAIRTEIP